MGEARILKTGDNVTPNEFEFTYTGNYNYKEGASGTIELEFLTSGTFKLLKSSPFKPFDLCLVGGGGNGGQGKSNDKAGGGGGGGGYVENIFDVPIELNKAYPIVIGGSAGDTTGFGYTAKAGFAGQNAGPGGAGGSGGGSAGGMGGSNGSDGLGIEGGVGQKTTTRAFGTGKLFGGGGGGGYSGKAGSAGAGGTGGGGAGGRENAGSPGADNTGGGGGGGGWNSVVSANGGAGGSGIIILRRRWNPELTIVNNYNFVTNNITTA